MNPVSAHVVATAEPMARRGAVRRSLDLARAADRALRSRFGAQVAKVSAWIITLGYALTMIILARATGGALLEKLVVDGLFWLTWLTAGLVAFSAAGAAKDPAHRRALESLARQRGFSAAAVRDAAGVAVLRRIVRLTLVPALVLALLALALSGSLRAAIGPLLLAIGVIGYVLVTALLLGGLAHVAASLAPQQGRSFLLFLLFVPHFARVLWPHLPSVPWVLAWMRDQLLSIGGLGA